MSRPGFVICSDRRSHRRGAVIHTRVNNEHCLFEGMISLNLRGCVLDAKCGRGWYGMFVFWYVHLIGAEEVV